MPIELVTGLPGAGKSLGAVSRMLEWRQSDASRPVFVLGVDGLKDGVAQVITPEDLERWHEYPAGSIFVVDEAQKYFPMRRAGDAPAWIRKLSEHRHLGHDFLLMTQAPGYLDTYVRGLIDRHTHLVRKFGTHRMALDFEGVGQQRVGSNMGSLEGQGGCNGSSEQSEHHGFNRCCCQRTRHAMTRNLRSSDAKPAHGDDTGQREELPAEPAAARFLLS